MENKFLSMCLQKKLQLAIHAFENDWKKQCDNGEKARVIFMDLSRAFDKISSTLFLEKLKAYGFSDQALSLLQSHLCKQILDKHYKRFFLQLE